MDTYRERSYKAPKLDTIEPEIICSRNAIVRTDSIGPMASAGSSKFESGNKGNVCGGYSTCIDSRRSSWSSPCRFLHHMRAACGTMFPPDNNYRFHT